MMEEHIEKRGEKKVTRKNSGKSFKSREHSKAEKRKQQKAWLKRKRERIQQHEHKAAVEEEPHEHEAAVEEEPRVREVVVETKKPNVEQSRGKKLVKLSRTVRTWGPLRITPPIWRVF